MDWPSASTDTLWLPSPRVLKLNSRPNPVLIPPHTDAVSARGPPYGIVIGAPPSITACTVLAWHTHPEIRPMPEAAGGAGFSSVPVTACASVKVQPATKANNLFMVDSYANDDAGCATWTPASQSVASL